MRIVIADFGGYAFIAQLARELARRGHHVRFSCFADLQSPKGGLRVNGDDPPNFSLHAISLREPFQKYSFFRRRGQERRLGKAFADDAIAYGADVVVAANMPLEVLLTLQAGLKGRAIRFVYWLQDIISLAMKDILTRRLGLIGRLAARYYAWREAQILRRSDVLIAISDSFLDALGRNCPPRSHVIPNWAPLDELPVLPRDNEWARAHDLVGRKVLLYAGTMGLKHNPELVVQAALRLRALPDARVVVVSEGLGADYLAEQKRAQALDNLLLLRYQPPEQIASMLASGDVLTAFLDRQAAQFSVPSKLLSYFCAARAPLLATSGDNLAALSVRENALGVVVEPDATAEFAEAAFRLLVDDDLRAQYAGRARAFAEANFDIGRIASRFEEIIGTVSVDSIRRSAPRPAGSGRTIQTEVER
jgi:glycosyltransferase involved in cell wall biosynthesis